jgi:hypothetical protein
LNPVAPCLHLGDNVEVRHELQLACVVCSVALPSAAHLASLVADSIHYLLLSLADISHSWPLQQLGDSIAV